MIGREPGVGNAAAVQGILRFWKRAPNSAEKEAFVGVLLDRLSNGQSCPHCPAPPPTIPDAEQVRRDWFSGQAGPRTEVALPGSAGFIRQLDRFGREDGSRPRIEQLSLNRALRCEVLPWVMRPNGSRTWRGLRTLCNPSGVDILHIHSRVRFATPGCRLRSFQVDDACTLQR